MSLHLTVRLNKSKSTRLSLLTVLATFSVHTHTTSRISLDSTVSTKLSIKVHTLWYISHSLTKVFSGCKVHCLHKHCPQKHSLSMSFNINVYATTYDDHSLWRYTATVPPHWSLYVSVQLINHCSLNKVTAGWLMTLSSSIKVLHKYKVLHYDYHWQYCSKCLSLQNINFYSTTLINLLNVVLQKSWFSLRSRNTLQVNQ